VTRGRREPVYSTLLRLREAFSLGGLTVPELARRTWKAITEHEIMTRAAAVSFYAMLAAVPFLALVLTLAVQLLPDRLLAAGQPGSDNAFVRAFEQTLESLPADAYEVIQDQITRIQQQPPVGLLSVGLAVTLWLASSLFVAVIDAMDAIYGVQETRPFWRLRLTAILMTIIQAIILVGSLVAILAWPLILRAVGLSEYEPAAYLATAIKWMIVFAMVLLSFALAFYVGPDAEQHWEWITPGSLVGTFLFLLASWGFRVYVQNWGNYDKTYGSLGGVMVLLFWFWLSSLILLGAAEMNKVIEHASPLGKFKGQKVDPGAAPDFEAMVPEPASRSSDQG
jgi:membrane protein